jgi:hypothetical protein
MLLVWKCIKYRIFGMLIVLLCSVHVKYRTLRENLTLKMFRLDIYIEELIRQSIGL